MRMPQTALGTVMLLVTFGLMGCSPSSDYSDIEAFMDEVDSRPRGRIEPLPPIETIPPFAYTASTKRSPFDPPQKVKPINKQSGPKVTPIPNRVKEFLEQFPIGQLSMVGTLAQGGTMFALIQDGEGGVHRVKRGDYVGTDHGQIATVSDTTIELIEIVPDGTGGWVERARTVALAIGT